MTIDELIIKCEKHAVEQAEKDLLFHGISVLKKLDIDDQRVICNALKHYAATAANRTARLLAREGL